MDRVNNHVRSRKNTSNFSNNHLSSNIKVAKKKKVKVFRCSENILSNSCGFIM